MPDQALAGTGNQVAQAAADFQWDGHGFEAGIGIALSGGGFRAMLFHAGALMRLNELGVLSRAKRISSVSGGSIAAGYLATVWNKLGAADANGVFKADNFEAAYVHPLLGFSRQKIDIIDALTGLLPWTSAAEEVAAEYEKYLLGTRTLQDVPDQPRWESQKSIGASRRNAWRWHGTVESPQTRARLAPLFVRSVGLFSQLPPNLSHFF
jgi:NTE family protein